MLSVDRFACGRNLSTRTLGFVVVTHVNTQRWNTIQMILEEVRVFTLPPHPLRPANTRFAEGVEIITPIGPVCPEIANEVTLHMHTRTSNTMGIWGIQTSIQIAGAI